MKLLALILNRNKLYFLSFSMFFLVALVSCCAFSKSTNFISLNFFHTHYLDNFFTFYTYMGDGILALLVFVALIIFRQYLNATHILLAFITSGIAAQIIKNLSHAPRPREFFKPGAYGNFIEGVTHTGWASFPSGHSTTAFALATILALHTRNKVWGLLYLFLAIAEGYSRVYLGQHFLEDVVAGSLIGVFFAIGTFYFVRQIRIFRWNISPDPATSFMAMH
jgi:membrane-associated phospholipid phosphatase